MSAHRQAILIVDDTPENLAVLDGLLRAEYTVRPALNGPAALRIAADTRPDLILLDIMMPGMDGHEVCRRLQADPRTRNIPIIFVTALSDVSEELRGLELGAVDYITKPYIASIVQARVRTHLALREARQRLEEHNQYLLQERHLVEDIILRLRTAESFDPRHLRWLLSSVDRTNGDLLLAAFSPDGRQRVLVGDIAGHGPSAAVCVPLVAHVFYRLAASAAPAADIFRELDEVMHRQLPPNIFMAGCLLEIPPARDEAVLWNAGLPGCLVRRADGRLEAVESANFPFGMRAGQDVEAGRRRVGLAAGDRLYLFSDGMTEICSPAGEGFGEARVEAFIAGLAPDAPLDGILAGLAAHRGDSDFPDDITLVEISA